MSRTGLRLAGIASTLVLVLAACGGGTGSTPGGGAAASGSAAGSGGAAAGAKGPIKIWYSNNKEEVTWGKAVVDAWNKDHPNEQVTGEEIPAGTSPRK